MNKISQVRILEFISLLEVMVECDHVYIFFCCRCYSLGLCWMINLISWWGREG